MGAKVIGMYQIQPPGQRWYLASNGATHGPYEQAQVMAWLASRQVAGDALACPEGGQEWHPIYAWPTLATALPYSPPTIGPGSAYGNSSELARRMELRSIALWHRRYTIAIFLVFVTYVILAIAQAQLPNELRGALVSVAWLIQVTVSIGLAHSLRSGAAWVWCLVAIVPCCGVVSFVPLSMQATSAMQRAGVPVGLLGPKRIP